MCVYVCVCGQQGGSSIAGQSEWTGSPPRTPHTTQIRVRPWHSLRKENEGRRPGLSSKILILARRLSVCSIGHLTLSMYRRGGRKGGAKKQRENRRVGLCAWLAPEPRV
mmetsp:Transcript_4644/g.10753  ORF Transcript_4644/g.10753 Transcript_4644/m.10753 type:complete len:109 (-) Transcript_4644:615-941(-)